MRILRDKSLLMIVDLQDKLLPVIDGGAQVIAEAAWLGSLALDLEVPVWFTEQYPEGLGHTHRQLRDALPGAKYWSKASFGAHDEPTLARGLKESGCQQIILCGAEAHICVMQTALGLLSAGYEVYWLVEAIASRRYQEAKLAQKRITAAGAVPVSADMVAYEWLQRCDTAQFKRAHRKFLKARSARPLRF